MKSAENLLRALCRALLANDQIEPQIVIRSGGGLSRAEIDVRPFDAAPLIGGGGAMKFAIQGILAGPASPTSWAIQYANTGTLRCPENQGRKPDAKAMKSVLDAAVNHWRAQGYQCKADVELSESTVIAILTMPDDLRKAQQGPFSRIARAIGKANGYRATVVLEKLVAA